MAILAAMNYLAQNDKGGNGPPVVAAIFLFVFNTFFAIGWLGMTWLYPAEIVPLRIRASANGLSTSANWIFNFMVVMITPVSFSSIGYKTYIIFAVINAFILPVVYFFYPETAYRSLEEMDHIFHQVSGWKGYFTVVHQAEIEPRWCGKNGELLVDDAESGSTSGGNETREKDKKHDERKMREKETGVSGTRSGGDSGSNSEADVAHAETTKD